VKRPQWITLGISFLLVIALYAATQSQLFGERKPKLSAAPAHSDHAALSVDSILYYSKQNLTKEQSVRINELENSISRGDVSSQKLHLYHQLARFWGDSIRSFPPYAWYTAEAARLENSEKSLTFAAHLFLDNLMYEEDHLMKEWEASQAKDLFERSLKLNPNNDSSKVGLGATILFGGSEMPMQGIQMLKEVVAKDSTNAYAQMTLGRGSLLSGQLDKAIERFKTVARLEPKNLEVVLLLADTYEKMGNKQEAIVWYQKSLTILDKPEFKKEVENRITELKNKK
jgi:tetratricopeptide (TPR) repeat protein